MLEPGNVSVAAPYVITGKTGTLTARSAADPLWTLVNLGRPNDVGTMLNVPIYVSQIRMKYAQTTQTAALAIAFEIHKVGVTAQRTTGTAAKTVIPTSRKTSGYPAIPATEVNAWVAGTDATGGGTIVVADTNSPFDVCCIGGGAATIPLGSESVWMPSDLCPLIIEKGEGLEVRVIQHNGTGVFFCAVDFLRQ